MAKKRGFFAELNHQNQLAAKRREQAQRQAVQAQLAAARNAERAYRQAERAQAQAERAAVADAKRAHKDAQRAYVEARELEVAAKNAELAIAYEEIDGILAATLDIDGHVDLESLRRVVEHPPFEPGQLALPAPPPPRLQTPPAPVFVAPPGEPKGLGGVFGGKKKYAETLERARTDFASTVRDWENEVAAIPVQQQRLDDAYAAAERERQARLADARGSYDEECRQRDADVARTNAELDRLIANLGYDVEEAVQEYVGIVLGNSVYPDSFMVEHDFEFDSAHRELSLTVSVPEPGSIPVVREYKYSKAKDEVASSPVPQRDQRDRYANAVASVALRTLHEVFEADRTGRIHTISLVITTTAVDQGTGRLVDVPLVAVATDRSTFEEIDLSNVVPTATLAFLKASVSKNAYGLVPADLSRGVRG